VWFAKAGSGRREGKAETERAFFGAGEPDLESLYDGGTTSSGRGSALLNDDDDNDDNDDDDDGVGVDGVDLLPNDADAVPEPEPEPELEPEPEPEAEAEAEADVGLRLVPILPDGTTLEPAPEPEPEPEPDSNTNDHDQKKEKEADGEEVMPSASSSDVERSTTDDTAAAIPREDPTQADNDPVVAKPKAMP
jgi:hypothetical protein